LTLRTIAISKRSKIKLIAFCEVIKYLLAIRNSFPTSAPDEGRREDFKSIYD